MNFEKDLAEFVIKISKAEYSEARFEEEESKIFILKNGNFEPSIEEKSKGLGIRIINNGASFVSISNLSKKKIRESVKRALKEAKLSSPILLSEEKANRASYKYVKDFASEKEIKDFLISLDKRISFPWIKSKIFMLKNILTKKYFVNSDGSKIYSEIQRFYLEYNIVAKENSKIEQRDFVFGSSGSWKDFLSLKVEKKIEEEARIMKEILKARKNKKGKFDVIFAPELIGIIVHESCGHPLEADRILGREAAQAGESYAKINSIGLRIGSEKVTIVDDPTIKKSFGFYLFDDEGVKARRKFLIKEGVINEFLLNRETALVLKTKSNASARAMNYTREPIVRMSNTFMLPGDYKLEEMVEDIKKGILIKSFTEWNIDDIRWNEKYVGFESYEIENGEIKNFIRRPTIETTTQEIYSKIDACSKDLEFVAGVCGKGEPMQGVPVWMGGPYVRVRELRVK
ncbi:MAG: TldD/PmbA family protein [Candidatus Aenigmatarchaeota archaeon]|jgi:TldD protein